MFEVGKYYQITTGVNADDIGYSTYKVLAYEPPLLKVEGGDGVKILNTSAPTFHEAKLHENQAPFGVQIELGSNE